MRISNSDPVSFSEWLLSVHSFLDTRINLQHYLTKEQGIQHPFQENLLRSIKLYNKNRANYFYLAEHKRLWSLQQQNYLQRFHSFIKKSFLFRSKALAFSSPVHRLTHSLYPGPDAVCWHLTSHLITKLPLCSDSSCWRNLNWTDTFAEALVVWKHFKILLFPFHFLTNGQHTFSSGTILVDTEWA